uniref:Uncharacterized protein n=1 Tax=Paramormyrops kingsleyae TaxID=1676925 RepID=A0A3B3QI96_9TELE
MSFVGSKRAARLLLCLPGMLPASRFPPDPMIPVHLLICFCRYLRWLTFRLDFTGLSRASLILLEAESMKLRRSRVVSRKSPSQATSPRRLPSNGFSASYSMPDPRKQKFMNWEVTMGACTAISLSHPALSPTAFATLPALPNLQIHSRGSTTSLRGEQLTGWAVKSYSQERTDSFVGAAMGAQSS